MQHPSRAHASRRVAPLLTVAGGALIVLGCLMPWFELRAHFTPFDSSMPRARAVGGLDTSKGTLLLVIGIVVAVLGVVAMFVQSPTAGLGASIAAAIGALFVGAFAVYDALTPTPAAVEGISNEIGAGDVAHPFIQGLFDRGIITIDATIGLWLVVVGGVVGVVGGVLAVFAPPRSTSVQAPARSDAVVSEGGRAPD